MVKEYEKNASEVNSAWSAAMEALGDEKVAREVERSVEWLRMARAREKMPLDPCLTIFGAQKKIADIGVRRMEQLRRVRKFEEADRALMLTQQYLSFLERLTSEHAFSNEELHAYLTHCVQEHTDSLPRVE